MESDLGLEAASAGSLRRLVETGLALSAELTLETLLRRIIETAVDLTGATYGALGVVDQQGTALEQFITVGVDDATRAMIGDLPRGRGILGVLIREGAPLRLRDLHADPRSVGFPPGHPSMESFLGMPIVLRGNVFGNLYLTEKQGADEFSEADEEIVRLLAAQAAVAIENARLYESTRRWSRQLESLNDVADALAADTEIDAVFELAVSRLRELIDARSVTIMLPTSDRQALVVQAASGEEAERLVGLRFDRQASKAGLTFTRRRPERIDSLLDDPEVDQRAPRLVEATSALYIPLSVGERAVGVMAAYDKQGNDSRFSDSDLRLARVFANRVSLAVILSERVGRESVRALLDGQELERKRLARELHDETGQALASILLGLKSIERQVGTEPVATIRELVSSALDDVRRLTVELRPPALDDFGLEAALERLTSVLATRSGLDIRMSITLPEHALPDAEQTALYRIVQEALTNVVKHAGARSVSIVVTPAGGTLRLVIEDDGSGFEPERVRPDALGLVGMRERVAVLDGSVKVESAPGAGTTIMVELPAQIR
jgi:two-component system, NarL family, sensor histidine kinase DevS